jgi:hypothetical protein
MIGRTNGRNYSHSANNKQVQGITTIEPEVIRKFLEPSGIENILKTLPGVKFRIAELEFNML